MLLASEYQIDLHIGTTQEPQSCGPSVWDIGIMINSRGHKVSFTLSRHGIARSKWRGSLVKAYTLSLYH